jgi:hypothetical protein
MQANTYSGGEMIRKYFDKIEGIFLLSFIRVLLELSWSLKISGEFENF